MRAAVAGSGTRWWTFERAEDVLETRDLRDVLRICREAELATDRGLWAVGFLGYEAAPAFDAALPTREPDPELPLVRWGLFPPPRCTPPPPRRPLPPIDWRTQEGRLWHAASVAAIRTSIARGDTYQANLTFPLLGSFESDGEGSWDPIDWLGVFRGLWDRQRSRRAVFLEDDRHAILSLSPELFLERRGDRVRSEPIKGTASRGRFASEDLALAEGLASSAKERAENVMIVDMIRNDLGRVALPGSVRVPWLCRVESWGTVHQLVSRVDAVVQSSWVDLLRAAFPCASITGAPKRRTMSILAGLERVPRGIYTGAVGWWAPGRRGRLSVAIRTMVVDHERKAARYGTGGGIVWDSDAAAEWTECRTKALLVQGGGGSSRRYLETILWTPARGWVLLDAHLDRLHASARRFGDRAVRRTSIRQRLHAFEAHLSERSRVRLLVGANGDIELESTPLESRCRRECSLAVDTIPVDSTDLRLFHKTDQRDRYEEAAARFPDSDDVLLWNERGEVTETCRANIAVRARGTWCTPPLDSGLLPGTLRGRLIARGRIEERPLRREDLEGASEVIVFNSVRGFVRAGTIDGLDRLPAAEAAERPER